MCDQCRATSYLSHPITGCTLTRLTGAGQSPFCSLAVTVSDVPRERWLQVFWILLIRSRYRSAHWDLWNRTITEGTPYNTAPYITGSNIARLGHGSQNSWSKLWIPVVKSAPVRVIFAWKSVPKKRIHGSSDIYLGTQWKQRHDSPWPNRLDVIVTFLWYDTIRIIGHRDHQSTTKKV